MLLCGSVFNRDVLCVNGCMYSYVRFVRVYVFGKCSFRGPEEIVLRENVHILRL